MQIRRRSNKPDVSAKPHDLHFTPGVPLPGSSHSSKSYDEDLLFGHGGSLTLSHLSFLLSSPSPHFGLFFLPPAVLSQ